MQYSVPHAVARKKRVGFKVAVLLIAVCLLCLGLFFLFRAKRTDFLDERSLYLVYVDSGRELKSLETEADIVKHLGGAGEIYDFQGLRYIVTSVYFDLSEAQEVLSGLKDKFKNAGVIDLYTKVLSQKTKQQINGNFELRDYYKSLVEFLEENHEKVIEYAKGELLEGEYCSFLVRARQELFEKKERLWEESEQSDFVLNTYHGCCRMLGILDEFLDKYYSSRVKTSLVYKLDMNIALEYYEIINNLQ